MLCVLIVIAVCSQEKLKTTVEGTNVEELKKLDWTCEGGEEETRKLTSITTFKPHPACASLVSVNVDKLHWWTDCPAWAWLRRNNESEGGIMLRIFCIEYCRDDYGTGAAI